MAIVKPVPYWGNAHPCSMYRNGVKLAGYRWDEQSGTDMPFEGTYNDRVDVAAMGRSYQDGEPSPDNPIPIISSAGEMRVEGRNVLDGEIELGGFNNATGAPSSTINCVRSTNFTPVRPSTQYAMHNDRGYAKYVYFYASDYSFIELKTHTASVPHVFMTPVNARYIKYRSISGNTENDLSAKYWMVRGSYTETTMPRYTPYRPVISFPIPELRAIPATYNPDGSVATWVARDELYVERVGGEWHLMRRQRVGRVVYDGSESNWQMFVGADLNQFYTLQADVLHNAAAARVISSHYKRWYINARVGNYGTVYTHGGGIAFNDSRFPIPPLGEDRTQVLANWRAWLAAHPVTVDYILAVPIITDLGPIDLPSYYPFTRVLVSGDYPPDVTATCKVVDRG